MTRACYFRATLLRNVTVVLPENMTLVRSRDNSNFIDFKKIGVKRTDSEKDFVNSINTIIVESN